MSEGFISVKGPAVSGEVARILELLPQAWFISDGQGEVLQASPRAFEYGLIVLERIEEAQTRDLIAEVQANGEQLERELSIPRTRTHADQTLLFRVTPIADGAVLVLIEDVTQERILDVIRRDFVANVSHELKTPVGALSLLAEAIQSAIDDPEKILHFASRMHREAERLSILVGDLIDLSSLQKHDGNTNFELISVDDLVTVALDDVQMLATAKGIEMVVGGTGNLRVNGNRDQLISALRNLLTNAIHYSHDGTRVAIGTRAVDEFVEISVVDQGIGIPTSESERIFERFYRVDPARSRITGGTGLGLSIVKHVCVEHGGECFVWSQEGHGSTFTIRLPNPDLNLPDNLNKENAE
jgi:two-component system sensor histidine kinase SenX3